MTDKRNKDTYGLDYATSTIEDYANVLVQTCREAGLNEPEVQSVKDAFMAGAQVTLNMAIVSLNANKPQRIEQMVDEVTRYVYAEIMRRYTDADDGVVN